MTERYHPPADPPPPDPPAAAVETYALPVSVAQQRFWYLNQLDPGNPASNIALRFDLCGPFDRDSLHRAVAEVVRRHESLRTTFAEADGQPVQVVHPAVAVDLPCDDLTGLAEADRPARAEAITRGEGSRPFDLTAGPLLRVRLLRLAADRHVLLLTVHHIVADGWSTGVLLDELAAVYEAYALGRPSPLPEPALQYGDYAIWEQQSLADSSLDGQLRYWVGQLAGRPTGSVPTDRPRQTHRPATGEMESVLLPRELTDRLADLARRQGATLFMLSLAAVKVLVARLSGATDVCVGSLTAGRSRVELEPLVGVFVNPLAFRTRLDGDPTFTQLLDRVRGTVVDALANQDVPFDRVLDAAHPPRHPDRHPLFQVNLIHQRAFLKPHRVAGLSIRPVPSISPGALYDLNFIMVERGEGWRLSCEYNPDLFEAATVRGMLDHIAELLRGAADAPEARLSELPGKWRAAPPAPPPARPAWPERASYAAPRNDTEARLEAIWREVLRADRVGVDADFFDEGGHSILAARLLLRVEQAFGRRLSLNTFLAAPTIRTQAELLSAGEGPDAVGPPGRSDGVLFLFHDGSGQTFVYHALGRRLRPDLSVVGIEPVQTAAAPILHTRLQEMADDYTERVRAAQPAGPYLLGGHCFGGLLAYEVAARLEAAGEVVRLVALLDSGVPGEPGRSRGLGRHWARIAAAAPAPAAGRVAGVERASQWARWLYRLLSGSLRYFLWHAYARAVNGSRLRRLQAARDRGAAAPRSAARLPVSYVLSRAAQEYRPGGRVKAPLVLFRATGGSGDDAAFLHRYVDPLFGWGGRSEAGETVCDVPGTHTSMLYEPNVGVIAERIADFRRAATPPGRPQPGGAGNPGRGPTG